MLVSNLQLPRCQTIATLLTAALSSLPFRSDLLTLGSTLHQLCPRSHPKSSLMWDAFERRASQASTYSGGQCGRTLHIGPEGEGGKIICADREAFNTSSRDCQIISVGSNGQTEVSAPVPTPPTPIPTPT